MKEPQQSNIWINTIYVFPNSYCTFDQTDTMISIPMQTFSNFIHWKTPHRTQLEYVSTTRKPYDIYHFMKEPQQSNIWINTIYVFPNSYCTFDQTDTMISIPMQTFSNLIHLLLAFWYCICLIWKQICDITLPVWMICYSKYGILNGLWFWYIVVFSKITRAGCS